MLSLLSLLGLATAASALTSSLQQVTSSFGSNPTNVGFYYYKPTTVATKPKLIVAIHECTASGPNYFSSTTYSSLADTYGFIVIYPSSPWSGTCWDVSSTATLTHNGGSDSEGIASMVSYAISTWNVDSSNVFVTGTSSGGASPKLSDVSSSNWIDVAAMMTNVMAAVYPELFRAASVYSGVAAGCFAEPGEADDSWNAQCAEGDVSKTPAQWAAIVKAMYPGYTGTYPAIQEYHGTADTTLYYPNLAQEIAEWSGIFGYGSATSVVQNTPQSGYTKSIYGPALQGISAAGVGHTVPVQEAQDLIWFGITTGGTAGVPEPAVGSSGSTTTGSTTTTTTTSSTSTSPPSSSSVPGERLSEGFCPVLKPFRMGTMRRHRIYWFDRLCVALRLQRVEWCVALFDFFTPTDVYAAYYSQCLPA
uniref:Carboxylic ester hydrolase n=1 Tax=Mycena chlorophos TaxID=658473 RepID=A0ABQ0KZC1_MYCCL|nr:predicted protein [Mycena chlorophos]